MSSQLEQKFKEISGGNEFINKEQLKSYLLGQKDASGQALIKEDDFNTVFEKIDANHDGKVSFEEFSLFSAFCRKETSHLFKDLVPVF